MENEKYVVEEKIKPILSTEDLAVIIDAYLVTSKLDEMSELLIGEIVVPTNNSIAGRIEKLFNLIRRACNEEKFKPTDGDLYSDPFYELLVKDDLDSLEKAKILLSK